MDASIPKGSIPKVGTAISSALPNAIPSSAEIGAFIREQRHNAKLSLRRLADEAGVSNPYLSQIERGLRKPSAEILQQLAKGLRISAEQLYVQAGLLEERGTSLEVEGAIISDTAINERQKRVLLDIYSSFVAENVAADSDAELTAQVASAAKPASKRSARKNGQTPGKGASAAKSAKKTTKKSAKQKTAATRVHKGSTSARKTTTKKTGQSKATTSKTAKSSRRPTTH